MITYQLDDQGILVFVNPDYSLQPMNSVLVEPPHFNVGYLAKWVSDLDPITDVDFGHEGTGRWLVMKDNRGVKLYNKATGLEYDGEYNGLGEIPITTTFVKPPSSKHTWINDEWVLTDIQKQEVDEEELAFSKERKLADINNHAQSFVNKNAQLDKVPSFEIQTWIIQAAEAKAWEANNNALTPTLDNIAAARGVDRIELIQKVLFKTKAFEQLVAVVAGQRQAYEDALKQSNSIEEVDRINPVYKEVS